MFEVNRHITPSNVLHKIREKGLKEPKLFKLKYQMKKIRSKTYGIKPVVKLSDIEDDEDDEDDNR